MLSFGNLIVILLIVLLLFGANRVPEVMINIAKGLKAFKNTLSEGKKKKQNDEDN